MNQNNVLQLKMEGKVTTGDNREFTRLIGGFGEDRPMFLLWQVGELLNQETEVVKQNFERNESNFEEGIDFIDLKVAPTLSGSYETIDITKFLKEVGYSRQRLNATKRWLAFSFSGMMKLVKIATTKESWSIYNNFLEDYFKTKAENLVMEKTLQEELDFLKEQKKFILGSMFMETDETKKMEFFTQNEKLNNRISEIEITLSKEQLVEQLKPQLSIAEKFTHAKVNYDIGRFSKVLKIDNMGRNNLFKWLREQKILMTSNEPYQRYMDYFEVLPLENKYTDRIDYKTMIKPNGVEYIVKRLIKDGKIITKTVEQILAELDSENILNKTA